ncbi:MAG: EpsI family protein, partial [Desulfuromonadaceae bacterium]
PGSGWLKLSENVRSLEIAGQKLNLVEAVYQNGDARELFLYWFQVKGQSITNEYALKFAEVKNSILYNRRDSAFVRISVPYHEGEQGIPDLAEQFVRDFYAQIVAVLPQ